MKHHVYKSVRNIGGGNFGRVDLVESETDAKYYVMKVHMRAIIETEANLIEQVGNT